MNTSNLADISDIIGSFAVLITLIFLVLQIRENNRAIKASTKQAATDAENQYLLKGLSDPGMIYTWTKPELTDDEVVKHYLTMTLFLRLRENEWVQYQNGVMDAETWNRYKGRVSMPLRYERNRNWWKNVGKVRFDPGFVEEVNRIMGETPLGEGNVADVMRQLLV